MQEKDITTYKLWASIASLRSGHLKKAGKKALHLMDIWGKSILGREQAGKGLRQKHAWQVCGMNKGKAGEASQILRVTVRVLALPVVKRGATGGFGAEQ